MRFLKTESGFSLESDGVTFDFSTDATLTAEGSLYRYPAKGSIPVPVICRGDRLLLPIDEGIALTAERKYEAGELDCDDINCCFCGRDGSLSMVIVERAGKFLLIALRDGTYGRYRAVRVDGLYQLEMVTDEETPVTYGIFDKLSDACQCYRRFKGHSPVTLREKRARNPKIDKLIGGAIFWFWNENYDELMYSEHETDVSATVGDALLGAAERIRNAGVDKALMGIFFSEDSAYVSELYRKYGYLATQYDNYSDVMDPKLLELVPNNRARACDYTRRRMKDYPDGVRVSGDGTLAPAWSLKGFDGNFYSQNRLCPAVAKERMMEEIPQILAQYPDYAGRFIDVLGVRSERCCSEAHPLTLKESIQVKGEAFSFLGDIGLIAGTEDGFEDLLDSLVYTEGMHSPMLFRNRNSGRQHAHTYSTEREEHIRAQMLDPSCRVPLWHLVYHDSLIAFPYWGDSTASSEALLGRKVLFACLYGCAPLYSCFVKELDGLLDGIISSYQKITAVHEKVAELPMTDFEVLSGDYLLQRSVFGDRYEVIANFSDEERCYNGRTVKPNDYLFGTL